MTAPCTSVAPKPPAAQLTLRRAEAKYLLGPAQREELLRLMASRMMPDEHGPSTVRNVYYDTPTALLARRSAEKPDSAPKRYEYRGMATISCHTPVFVAGPDGAGAPLRHQTFLARFPSASALRQARNALASGA